MTREEFMAIPICELGEAWNGMVELEGIGPLREGPSNSKVLAALTENTIAAIFDDGPVPDAVHAMLSPIVSVTVSLVFRLGVFYGRTHPVTSELQDL